ncbi:DUF3168 domain-containing protein [Thalassovita sp.]|jgi:hypothetical protein|uniref:DUF3168 domain-containing protein n=1 Tax=Thalassovita sp. TaxID=1979401 RepID=UPI003B5B6680
MSYAMSAALQGAVFQQLITDTTLGGLVGANVFDAVPAGEVPDTYVSLGPELVRDRSDKTGAGAEHEFTVTVYTTEAGFSGAKEVAAAICDALVDAPLALSRGHLVAMNFFKAQAVRDRTGSGRRIDLKFRARVEDN